MLAFALRRLVSAVPTLFIVVTLSFFLMRIAPGGPFNLERPLEPQVLANLNRVYELDQPLVVQYVHYLWNVLHGDFGPSFVYRDYTVAELILQALPYSVILGSFALVISVIGGIAVGTFAALRQNSAIDYAVMSMATIGTTVPNFVVGPVLSLVFAVMLRLVPAGGWGNGGFDDLVLPMVALALPQLAVFARLTRGSMIEALRADHVRTARAYGLPARSVVVRHALRAALMPAVSYLGPAAAGLLTGSVVVETIFSLPGVGRYFVLGALNRDYTLVMGTVVLISVFIVVFNLIVDILYAVIDPRVRYE
ncbi:oligopeptide ABC transporter permease OppB [Oharaeibacter diazotrophicus]|uniref:Oligopeptide transport system permease protein n=1 Tax=Oharaeibacter diazotrophicus TaxID=1920512 RepID=A0A4R6RLD1_9HYPH|nr:oligopeptide ABC transporter permease OppB [Oharaeibacter diazotrophicus]TDP87453.1 oligopeptide transport system permease protein [Oharaeibacter diazotrophicus]BBE70603.1 oligopeptide transport system permease protein OppB [Pleomorphomonas sp. SM30]GLS77349.1 alkaline phosphatase [Oharaeibacter diazotrophicus]